MRSGNMSHERVVVDISASPDLLRLVEEIEQSGAELVLARGEEELALVTQLPAAPARTPRRRPRRKPEHVLDILGIGASEGGSDIEHFKDHYIADAVDHRDV
jgi:hypothetical protein